MINRHKDSVEGKKVNYLIDSVGVTGSLSEHK